MNEIDAFTTQPCRYLDTAVCKKINAIVYRQRQRTFGAEYRLPLIFWPKLIHPAAAIAELLVLQRVGIACYADGCTSCGLICPSVRLSSVTRWYCVKTNDAVFTVR